MRFLIADRERIFGVYITHSTSSQRSDSSIKTSIKRKKGESLSLWTLNENGLPWPCSKKSWAISTQRVSISWVTRAPRFAVGSGDNQNWLQNSQCIDRNTDLQVEKIWPRYHGNWCVRPLERTSNLVENNLKISTRTSGGVNWTMEGPALGRTCTSSTTGANTSSMVSSEEGISKDFRHGKCKSFEGWRLKTC